MSSDVVYQSKGALIQFIETNMGTVTATSFIGDGSLLQNVTGSGGGGGGAPTDAQYVTLATDGDLSAERVLTAGTNISLTNDGTNITVASTTFGDVSVSGTPSNNQVPTWTNSTTIKGEGNLTFDGTTLALAGNETIITSDTGLTNDRALLVQNTADHCNIEVDAAASKDPNIILSENTTVKWSMGNDNTTDNLRFRDDGWVSRAELTQAGDLNITGDLTANGGDIYSIDAGGGDLFLRRNDSSIVADEVLGNVFFQATENGSDVSFGAAIRGVATETFVYPSAEGTKLEFLTTENGSGLYAVNMTLHNDGVLQVGSIKGNTDNNLTLFSDASMYFDIDEDNDSASSFYWRNGGNTTVMELDESGNLQMDGDLTVDGGDIVSTDATGGDLFLRRNESSIVADEVLGNVFFQATENGSDVSFGAAIRGVATETFVFPSAEGTKLEFLTTANGSGLYDVAMTLDGDGNLDIGGTLALGGASIAGPTDNNLTIKTDGSLFLDVDEDNDSSGAGVFCRNGANGTMLMVTEGGGTSIGGYTSGTGQRVEFLEGNGGTYDGYNGAYWEGSQASNDNANLVLEATNQQYDMLGPAWSTTTLYHYAISATPASTACNVRRATDGSAANNFTGQHNVSPADSQLVENLEDNIGLIVVANGSFKRYDERPSVDAWVTGKEAITIAEALPCVELATTPNDKRVFGVISNRPNEYLVDTETGEYEEDQDGVAKGFGNIHSEQVRINSIGEGAIWVCDISGNLENGDYITTCEIPGLGMKQDDDLLHNYTVAKITQDCDFRINASNYNVVEFEYSGSTYRKAFVGCTYHCG